MDARYVDRGIGGGEMSRIVVKTTCPMCDRDLSVAQFTLNGEVCNDCYGEEVSDGE
jgi:hypothetical protein